MYVKYFLLYCIVQILFLYLTNIFILSLSLLQLKCQIKNLDLLQFRCDGFASRHGGIFSDLNIINNSTFVISRAPHPSNTRRHPCLGAVHKQRHANLKTF